jgi:2'-5' RNA ligase
MTRRAIVTFPDTPAIERIEMLRRLFDPLASIIAAHVTLVFPFEDLTPTATLRAHVERMLTGTSAFDIQLSGVEAVEDEYVFLDLEAGRERLIELHDRLYTGLLATHLSNQHVFRPHVTLGRLGNRDALAAALAEARALMPAAATAVVREVAVVRLDGAAVADREFTVALEGSE